LSGFVDAEGCFTVSVVNRKQIQVRFIISQQGETNLLNEIAVLCKGRVSDVRSSARTLKDGTYRPDYIGDNLVVNLTFLKSIINYIEKFPLKTKKRISFHI